MPEPYVANPITLEKLTSADFRAGVRAEWEKMCRAGDYDGARALAFNMFIDVLDAVGLAERAASATPLAQSAASVLAAAVKMRELDEYLWTLVRQGIHLNDYPNEHSRAAVEWEAAEKEFEEAADAYRALLAQPINAPAVAG